MNQEDRVRFEKIEGEIKGMKDKVHEIDKAVGNIELAVCGNGTDGLKQRVERLENKAVKNLTLVFAGSAVLISFGTFVGRFAGWW